MDSSLAFVGPLEILFALFSLAGLLVGLIGTVFWIWMIIDCATKERSEGNDKVIWILIILLTHLIGALIYFFARRPARIREVGR